MICETVYELKPCPFCGYHKILLIKEKDYDTNIHDPLEKARLAEVWYHCVCLKCKASSGEHSNKEKTIESWNKRSESL